jgi:hypothetical protein
MTETLKVGDLAIYLTTGANKLAHGKVVQITEVLPYQLLYKALDGSTEGGTPRATLKPVTKASEVYKTGDRVRLVKPGNFELISYPKVVTGTVEMVGYSSRRELAHVKWDKKVSGGDGWWISFKDIEPAPGAGLDILAKVPPKAPSRRFSPGDRVRLVNGDGMSATAGAEAVVQDPAYKVKKFSGPLGYLMVSWDRSSGLDNGQHDGGYDEKGFELADLKGPVLPEEYILILFKDGKYLPSTEPKVYKSTAQAKRVAREMTERHGGEFRVMKLAGVSKAKEVKTFKAELIWG